MYVALRLHAPAHGMDTVPRLSLSLSACDASPPRGPPRAPFALRHAHVAVDTASHAPPGVLSEGMVCTGTSLRRMK